MSEKDKIPAGRSLLQLVFSFFFLIVYCGLFFLIAGDLYWTEGWIFSAIFFAGSFVIVLYLFFADPGLLNERFNAGAQRGQSFLDRIIILLVVAAYAAWFIIMPLDRRFHLSPEFPFWLKMIGAISLSLTFVIFIFTFRENSFAAPVVKIQKERGQKVISTGLYGIVRHPLYGGVVFLALGAPLLLGSIWGLIPGLALIIILAVRSVSEEETLKQGLDGYEDYMKKVRWRFIPYIF